MLKIFCRSAFFTLVLAAVTGCPSQPAGVVADPDEIEQYTTPESYDPASDGSPANAGR